MRRLAYLAVATAVQCELQKPGTAQGRSHTRDCTHWISSLSSNSPAMRTFSQGTQDGVLQLIFQRIGVTNARCVEFGFGYAGTKRGWEAINDHKGLNTRLLVQQGWQPTYFDALFGDASINVTQAVLNESNIASQFRAMGVPQLVDYVSIDVDSIDVWLLLGMLRGGYRPRVISCEFNSNFMSTHFVTMPREWVPVNSNARVYGASAAALNLVASMFGYRAVFANVREGSDILFIRSDILEPLCDPSTLPSTAQVFAGLPRGKHLGGKCVIKDARLLVDLPLSLAGMEEAARAKAILDVDELNRYYQSRKRPPYCLGMRKTAPQKQRTV